jgi:4-amino-4-deoxy-L-arabinose transferase-like glycosyltransferase
MNKHIPYTPEQRGTLFAWLGGTLAAAMLIRLAFWLTYSPVPYSDTPSYRRLAESVLEGFARYDGTRTPGYPAFLALVGPDVQVWVVQMTLGVLVALILFYLGWRLSGRSWFGALLALIHSINLGQLFFEANLLTETLTTFCLAAAFAGVYLLLRQETRPHWALSTATGTAVSLALLTRPLFVYLPVWVVLFLPHVVTTSVVTGKPSCWKNFLVRLVSFSIPVVLLVGGWVLFIHQRFGDWGLTTMTGYHLVQHTGSYFEYVPDEYAALRDTYIQFRDAKIAATGTQTNAIWEAIPELSRVSGLNFYDLSRTLARISVQLIRQHPDLFLQNVAEGWWMFWRAPVYWSSEALQAPGITGAIKTLVTTERALLVAINAFFVIGSLVWLGVCYLPARLIRRLPGLFQRLRAAFRPEDDPPGVGSINQHFMLFIAGNIWITSILQSLLDHGDNPRFLVPLQSFVVLWVAWFILKILRRGPEEIRNNE